MFACYLGRYLAWETMFGEVRRSSERPTPSSEEPTAVPLDATAQSRAEVGDKNVSGNFTNPSQSEKHKNPTSTSSIEPKWGRCRRSSQCFTSQHNCLAPNAAIGDVQDKQRQSSSTSCLEPGRVACGVVGTPRTTLGGFGRRRPRRHLPNNACASCPWVWILRHVPSLLISGFMMPLTSNQASVASRANPPFQPSFIQAL
jgi:hypothetical protein